MLGWLPTVYDFSRYVGMSTTKEGAIQSCFAVVSNSGYYCSEYEIDSETLIPKYLYIDGYGYYTFTITERKTTSGVIYQAYPEYSSEDLISNM